jgi:hypothetical protein
MQIGKLPRSDAGFARFLLIHFGDFVGLDFRLRLFDGCRSGAAASQPECDGGRRLSPAAAAFRFQDDGLATWIDNKTQTSKNK